MKDSVQYVSQTLKPALSTLSWISAWQISQQGLLSLLYSSDGRQVIIRTKCWFIIDWSLRTNLERNLNDNVEISFNNANTFETKRRTFWSDLWVKVTPAFIGPGGRLNIKMPSYQYRDSHVKDKTVSPTVLSLSWKPPYLGKTVFILRRGPDSLQRNVTPQMRFSLLESVSLDNDKWEYS